MYLVANFKAHAVDIAAYVARLRQIEAGRVELILAPSLLYLSRAGSAFPLAAQDVSAFKEGAYTGEVSASMLQGLGVRYALIGHSERRRLLHENGTLLSEKFNRCVEGGIHPIVCVGETLSEHTAGMHLEAIERQIAEVFAESSFIPMFAYEPVWAIGSGKIPSITSIQEVVALIKKIVPKAKVLYGGSVNKENARAIGEITDGLLVGSASNNVENFIEIIEQIEKL